LKIEKLLRICNLDEGIDVAQECDARLTGRAGNRSRAVTCS